MLDTREIDKQIEDLKDELEDYDPDLLNLDDDELEEKHGPIRDQCEELHALITFKEELEGYCDWKHGETLIREDEREAYAEQLAESLGMISRDAQWPLNHLNWEAAAEELFRFDYTYADLNGETYYVRCS